VLIVAKLGAVGVIDAVDGLGILEKKGIRGLDHCKEGWVGGGISCRCCS